MSGRPAGALPSVDEICARFIMVAGQYALLDSDLARYHKLRVGVLNDRMWPRLATLCDHSPVEWYVFDLSNGADDPLAYTLNGIIVALTVSNRDGPPTARAIEVTQRIIQALNRRKVLAAACE